MRTPLVATALVLLSTGALPAMAAPARLFISPSGNDANDCRDSTRACQTFAKTFARMAPGDELVLLDGSYTTGTTGVIHWDTAKYGSRSAQIPSGETAAETLVRAAHPGKAKIKGPLFIGRSTRKDGHIRIQGLLFEGGADLYNTSHVTLKETGIHGALGIGTNDHDQGNTDNLIEDVWVWATGERAIASNYRSHRNVWRRVVVRGDGCGTAACQGNGNPNVGLTVYDSHDVSVQNVIVIDRRLKAGDAPYADFAVASHTGGLYKFGRAEWLGTISLNAPDIGYYMEPDVNTTVAPTIKLSNVVAWNAATGGINLARSGQGIAVNGALAHTRADDAIRIAPELEGTGTLRNAVALGSGRFGLNSSYVGDHVNVSGHFDDGLFNQTMPVHLIEGDPRSNGALKHITRIEQGSMLDGTGRGGADVGANVLFRYGVDGARFGGSGYNTLSTVSLWPWPHEARIKKEMCAETAHGFCSKGTRLDGVHPVTLTSYIWEAAGHPIPF